VLSVEFTRDEKYESRLQINSVIYTGSSSTDVWLDARCYLWVILQFARTCGAKLSYKGFALIFWLSRKLEAVL